MSCRVVAALAVADFHERSRRPAYLVILAAAVALGYLALPPGDSLYVIMNAGGFRGLYNSAYVGTATALAGSLWLMIGGFYVVRGTIARDRQTRVGQILAATPLRSSTYLIGKFVSNIMVLASMAVMLAATAVVIQLARGESTTIDPGALLAPFVLLMLPVLAVTAGAAVLFDTVPALRAGLGNIVWFFLSMTVAIGSGGVPFVGMGRVTESMLAAMKAQDRSAAGEFSVGFTEVDRPLRVFTWDGLPLDGGLVTTQLTFTVVALVLATIPALWFGRFDPSRAVARHGELAIGAGHSPAATSIAAVEGLAHQRARPRLRIPVSPVETRSGPIFGRLLVGELRILWRGTNRWWWLVVAAITAAGIGIPAGAVDDWRTIAAGLLSAAWIWPVLIWSRLGTQRHENGLDSLLGAYPSAHRQVIAEWLAGVALTAAVGLGPLVRMAIEGHTAGMTSWLAAALFIPALALFLGTASRTHRIFQVLYLVLWYAAVNQVAAADYMGIVMDEGRSTGPSPATIAGISCVMLSSAFIIRAARHATR